MFPTSHQLVGWTFDSCNAEDSTVFRIDPPTRSGHIEGDGPCGDGRGQNWGRPVAATMEGLVKDDCVSTTPWMFPLPVSPEA